MEVFDVANGWCLPRTMYYEKGGPSPQDCITGNSITEDGTHVFCGVRYSI